MDENKQDPTQQCAKILSNDAAEAMVLSRYSSTPEEAKKMGLCQKHLGRSAVPGREV